VFAAKSETRDVGAARLAIGFDLAYSLDDATTFWRRGERGSSAFRNSLDWVGLDVFRRLVTALGRRPTAHLGERASDGARPDRGDAGDDPARRRAAADMHRSAYCTTDYRWFDVRDADSASPSIEDH
jgi:hypothetical protein